VKKTLGCALVLIVLLVGIGLAVAGSYNKLVDLQEAVESTWGNVENAYQRRADLVPNLVATVKGAAEFEQETFTQVTEARARVGQVSVAGLPDAAQLEQFQQAQGELSSALSRLLVVVERYPDLTATQAFRDLQVQLEGTENRIAVARRRFPAVLIAGTFGFDERPYFEAQEGAETAPRVEF
jgi:LemA protein